MKDSIAILITCHNRKKKTIRCLQSLYDTGYSFDVYLVDDGSTDGTSESVRHLFPSVKIIRGDGKLFWSGGMRLAWQEASYKDYDYYLWLNDDTVLYKHCFSELFDCHSRQQGKNMIQGILESEDHKEIIYSGMDKNMQPLVPDGRMQEITYITGNVLLVSKGVFQTVGNIDPKYWHDLGDYDYGLRAGELKIKTYTTTVPVGYGERNDINRPRLDHVNIVKRFRRLYSPLGSYPPVSFYFNKKHFGWGKAIVYYMYLHLINIMPDFLFHRVFKKR